MGRVARWTAMLAGVLLIACLTQLPATLRAASVLLQSVGLADPTGWLDQIRVPVEAAESPLTVDGHTVRSRLYRPTAGPSRTPVLLIHGIHPLGIDERRLQTLARAMAAVGHTVLTPALPELASLTATQDTVRRIRGCAAELESRTKMAAIVVGISVGGGLSLLAAAKDPAPTAIARVVTIGAHHDLTRVARHFAGRTAQAVDGTPAGTAPHPYGIQVLAYAHADVLFSASDLPIARESLHAYLDERYRLARAAIASVSPAGAQLLTALYDQPTGPTVGTQLLKAIESAQPELLAVSPTGQLDGLKRPIMLLHGASDPIIPATELSWIAKELPRGTLQRTLVTHALTHAEFPEDAHLSDYLALLRFVTVMLSPP